MYVIELQIQRSSFNSDTHVFYMWWPGSSSCHYFMLLIPVPVLMLTSACLSLETIREFTLTRNEENKAIRISLEKVSSLGEPARIQHVTLPIPLLKTLQTSLLSYTCVWEPMKKNNLKVILQERTQTFQ